VTILERIRAGEIVVVDGTDDLPDTPSDRFIPIARVHGELEFIERFGRDGV
jgi:hypothetical protein